MFVELRKLPGVDRLLQEPAVQNLIQIYGRELVVEGLRHALDTARDQIRRGASCPPAEEIMIQAEGYLRALARPTLRPVINASGVIIHTNLGRAPLSEETRMAMLDAARGYTNLEYDLEAGQRGSRYVHAEQLLCRLTGAEAALVVNNNAGAVLLILTALAQGREVIISRSQLIEIGGGFRIPDVMRQSGAHLVEVGTTNRTHLHDYEEAIGPETAALMRAHHSNFRIIGFTAEVPLEDLVALAGEHGLLVFDDLGSGTLLDTAAFGLAHEPTMQESVAVGADIVSCSGDKLLGGPQAGIILGRAKLIAHLRRHPLTRALRVDKTTLAGLQATLLHYLKGEAVDKIPVWQMIASRPDTLKQRAERWAQALSQTGVRAMVTEGRSTVGGGSLPGETLPTWLVALGVDSPDALAARLRAGEPPVIARIEDDRLCLDPRTVFEEEEETLLRAVQAAL
ncbi:MAG: L-seryl-tRNA(Sec) selenium transferase [Anaerolineae bacterium]|jgi:L-seryl-tRNA(Ser) seleniumtransferase|nr:L-seryl-tRNA(Sec) selenium transferase [Anaerolineae bacterium]MDH7474406.1 L-seryl-tRNA(Sec) selenium transferase [Anaerolineae bacterium]